MNRVLVIINRAITSDFTRSLIEQISILSTLKSERELILVHSNGTLKYSKYVEDVCGVKFDKEYSLYKEYKANICNKKLTWAEMFDTCIEQGGIDISNCTDVVFFGGILSSGAKLNRSNNALQSVLDKNLMRNFESIGKLLYCQLYGLSVARKFGCTVHETSYDPQENMLNLLKADCFFKPTKLYTYHGYDIPEYNMLRLDSLLYYEENFISGNLVNFVEKSSKLYDVVFGMTVFTKDREQQYHKIEQLFERKTENLRCKFYVKNKFLDIDTSVNRQKYLDLLSLAKFTFIIPSYDNDQFSIYRFQEAVNRGCLPLIFDDVNTKNFAKSFDLCPSKLLAIKILYENLVLPTEQERLDLLEYFSGKFKVKHLLRTS